MTLAVPRRTNVPRRTRKDPKDTPDRAFTKLAWGNHYWTEGVHCGTCINVWSCFPFYGTSRTGVKGSRGLKGSGLKVSRGQVHLEGPATHLCLVFTLCRSYEKKSDFAGPSVICMTIV